MMDFMLKIMDFEGQIRSERERAIIVTGYGPTMFPYWDDQGTACNYKYAVHYVLVYILYLKSG